LSVFNVPLAVVDPRRVQWRRRPKGIEATAYIDGYSFRAFHTALAAAGGVRDRVTASSCSFSWVSAAEPAFLTSGGCEPIAATMEAALVGRRMTGGVLARRAC